MNANMQSLIATEVSILSGFIFIFAALSFSIFIFGMIWEGDFKKKRGKWFYKVTMLSLAFSLMGAFTLVALTFSVMSTMHKIFNIIFMVTAFCLFLLIGKILKKAFIKKHMVRDITLYVAFIVFMMCVCLSYIWFP